MRHSCRRLRPASRFNPRTVRHARHEGRVAGSRAGERDGAGGGRERTSCQDLHLSKTLDKSSAELAMAVATGHTYSPVLLAAVRISGDRPLEFLRFTLTSVVISSVAFAGDTGTTARIETLVLRPTR